MESTYLGGEYGDHGNGIAVDNNGNVYVTGETYSSDFPVKNQYQTYQVLSHPFIAKLSFSERFPRAFYWPMFLPAITGAGNK